MKKKPLVKTIFEHFLSTTFFIFSNMNKRATKRKSATENYILKFLTVSSVSSDSIVKGIIDDIINTAVNTAEVDEQKTKYLQHFINHKCYSINAGCK
jgi:hypothetical protein